MQVGEYALVDAAKTVGVVVQKGMLVMRPHFALFVPTEAGVNALGAIAGGLVGAGAGFVVRVIPTQYPDVRSYVHALVTQPAQLFDQDVAALWQRAGWWYATPRDTQLTFKKVPLFSRYKCVLTKGKEHVAPTFGLPKPIATIIEPLANAWAQAAAAAKI